MGMLRRPSVVPVRLPFSKIFFSKTTGPIEAKFHVEPPRVGGTKVYSGHLGHMTKMAAMPIYGKNPCGLVCSIGALSSYFTARSNLVYAFIRGKLLESHLMEETYSK